MLTPLMSLTALQLSGFPAFHDAVRSHARALLDAHEAFPRLSSVFASEQRGMMANIGLSLYFQTGMEAGQRSIVLARFVELVERYGVASRNTADAFIKELLKYGYLRHSPAAGDRRVRPLEPTETAMAGVATWAMAHLRTLDELDGGARAEFFMRDPDVLSRLQPHIAHGLVGEGGQATYPPTLALFAWVNNAKLLTLRILAGMGPLEAGASRVSTDIDSIGDLAVWLNIARTHLTPKLREAEAMGGLGWSGARGKSPMWISTGFLREMVDEQAARLAFFDAAFDAIFSGESTQK